MFSNDDVKLERGKPPSTNCRYCTGLRGSARRTGLFLTTPLGVFALAVSMFLAGGYVATEVGVPGTALSETRAALDASAGELDRVKGELAVSEIQMERMRRVHEFSTRHDVPADLATTIFDVALAEGVEPTLAFRLVETESSFRKHAVSEAGAVGYAQIKPTTAAWLQPGITYDQLFETETNLRLGFRYLSFLLDRYDQDQRLALLAYNRGPTRVGSLLAMGRDPANGYAKRILADLP